MGVQYTIHSDTILHLGIGILLEVLCTGIHVPVVVSSYRLLLQEIARIENHLLNVACHAGDLGRLLSLLHMDSLDTTPVLLLMDVVYM